MLIGKICTVTNKEYSFEITDEQYTRVIRRWETKELIQRIVPELTPEQREFLISNKTPAEWNSMFPKEDDEEDKY